MAKPIRLMRVKLLLLGKYGNPEQPLRSELSDQVNNN